jgi:hypothetical protein
MADLVYSSPDGKYNFYIAKIPSTGQYHILMGQPSRPGFLNAINNYTYPTYGEAMAAISTYINPRSGFGRKRGGGKSTLKSVNDTIKYLGKV